MSKRCRSFVAVALTVFLCCAAGSGIAAENPRTQPAEFVQPLPQILPQLFQHSDTCNVFVLKEGNAALLVDLGDGSVLERLPNIGVERVEWVLFTHHHREQCQGIDRVDRRVTRIAAPQGERELFENPTAFRKWWPKLGDKFSVYGASYVRPPRSPIRIDESLAAGRRFPWRSWEIECVDTPGHSPDSMSYVLRRNGKNPKDGKTVVFTGDVMHDGARFVTWFDTEWDYGFGKGIDTLAESVERLIRIAPDVALPSHGPVIRNAAERLAEYRRKLAEFRADYVRGYPVFDLKPEERDPISQPTPVPHINRVTPHLYKLSHKTQGKNFAIIVADSGHALVLDCGLFPVSMLEEIIAGMRQHLGLKQIDAFWISHMHGDHFLLGPTLKQKYGAQAWTLDRIVDKCEHPRRYDYAALVSAYRDGFDGMKIDKAFRNGESVNWEGYRIQVDWMPGQTEFGCCLWLEIDGRRIAFTGDNLFGNPADPKQNGHEAVVARNSAVLEEGYILGSRYLLELKPDIVMGSHSFVMPNPAAFLQRYHDWSKRMAALYRKMLPGTNYEYGFDPYWVSAYPYRVDLSESAEATVEVTVRNFRTTSQRHRVDLVLPPGISATPAVLEGTLPSKSRRRYSVRLVRRSTEQNASAENAASASDSANRGRGAKSKAASDSAEAKSRPNTPSQTASATSEPVLQIVPFDITLDNRRYGQLFDFVVRTQ